MSLFNRFYQQIAANRLSHWLTCLPKQLADWQKNELHGEFSKWQKTLDALPNIEPSNVDLKNSVSVGSADSIPAGQQKRIENLLKNFKPWRKGPYHVHGTHVDTEWRSDFKLDRLRPHISDLKGCYVLDIGCGSGYHLWRMRRRSTGEHQV